MMHYKIHDPRHYLVRAMALAPFKKTILILGTIFLLWGTNIGTCLGNSEIEKVSGPELTTRARTALAKAQELMEKKEPMEAKGVLQEFLSSHGDENHHFVEFTLAGLFYTEGNLEDARTHFRKSVEINPDYGPGWQNLGKVCFDLRRFEEAATAMESTYRICKKKDPAHLFHAAVAHISANAPEKALDHMVFLTSGNAGDPETNWVKILTNLAIELKRPQKALTTVERLLNQPDPDPILWKLASNLYLTMGNHAKSAEALTVCSMLQPLADGEQTRLAGLYHSIGIPSKAADHYEKALKAKPSPRLYEQMVSARMESCDWGKALKAVDKGIAAYPNSKVLWKLKGWIAYECDNFASAARAFSRAMELDKSDKNSCFMKGLCTSKIGAFETARQALEQASTSPEYKNQALALLRQIEQRKNKP